MPADGVVFKPHHEIISFEEIVEVVKVAVELGITKFRLTGGEPLVRKDVVELIRMIKLIEGVSEISLTTNGILLQSMAKDLKEKYDQENQRLTNLKIALGQNETTLLITSTKNNIQSYRRDKVDAEKSQQNLLGMIQKFHTANIKLNELRDFILLKDDLLT